MVNITRAKKLRVGKGADGPRAEGNLGCQSCLPLQSGALKRAAVTQPLCPVPTEFMLKLGQK